MMNGTMSLARHSLNISRRLCALKRHTSRQTVKLKYTPSFLRYRQTFLPFSDAKVCIFADTGKKAATFQHFLCFLRPVCSAYLSQAGGADKENLPIFFFSIDIALQFGPVAGNPALTLVSE